VLNVNDPDFDIIYNELLERLDYLTKLDTKVFGEEIEVSGVVGDNFYCNGLSYARKAKSNQITLII
jgi:hypothetical protein